MTLFGVLCSFNFVATTHSFGFVFRWPSCNRRRHNSEVFRKFKSLANHPVIGAPVDSSVVLALALFTFTTVHHQIVTLVNLFVNCDYCVCVLVRFTFRGVFCTSVTLSEYVRQWAARLENSSTPRHKTACRVRLLSRLPTRPHHVTAPPVRSFWRTVPAASVRHAPSAR